MKIAIAPFTSPFTDFFVNLALYLEADGHIVHFLEPDKYIKRLLGKSKLSVVMYPQCKETTEYFTENDNLIKYYKRLLNYSDTQKLIRRKNSEYSNALKFFSTDHNYDKVLFWNGEGNVENRICKEKGITAMFLENGYFPNTLQINYGGVNCNATYSSLSLKSFSNYFFKEGEIEIQNFEIKLLKHNLFLRYILRSCDKKYNYLFRSIIKSNRARSKAKKRFSKLSEDNINLDIFGPYIFFPLQVNSDTQIVLNSSFDSMYEVLDTILPLIKDKGYKILIKEHPAEVENVDYSRFIDNNETFLIRKYPIDRILKKADLTICVNSSVGLQAIEAQSKVIVLGKSLYSAAPAAIQWSADMDILEAINDITIDKVETRKYISHLKNNIFIDGNWGHPDTRLLNKVSSRILASEA